MKIISRIASVGLVATLGVGAASADEFGRVLSSTPVIQAVSVPQQVCGPQQVVTQGGRTGAGALIGAVAGGALGNAVGRGSGRAAATGLGIFGGAVLGDQIESNGQQQTQIVQQCSTQNVVENRVTGYNVTYEYAGKQYAAQMANDPGRHVRLRIMLVGGSAAAPNDMAVPQATTYPTYPNR